MVKDDDVYCKASFAKDHDVMLFEKKSPAFSKIYFHSSAEAHERMSTFIYLSHYSMQFFGAIRNIFRTLHQELPSSLFYHDVEHVRDVYRMTRHIGRAEGLNDYELKLALTAAALHDSGFTKGNDTHEIRSCEIARQILPLYDYSPAEIAAIEGMILATTIPHKPVNLSEQVICDADLDYLGRSDFSERAEKLFQELKLQGIVTDRQSWNTIQVKFLNQHKYFTSTAIEARQTAKAQHLQDIQKQLGLL